MREHAESQDLDQPPDDQAFEAIAGADDGIPDDSEPATTPIKFTRDFAQSVSTEPTTHIVELNLSTSEVRVVESSDLPELTAEVLSEKCALTKAGVTTFGGQEMAVDVLDGMTLGVEIERSRLLDEYRNPEREKQRAERLKEIQAHHKGQEKDDLIKQVMDEYQDLELPEEQRLERENRTQQLIVARMIVDEGEPIYSFEGQPAGLPPIEACDPLLLNALWTAYLNANLLRVRDDWYQVHVRKVNPLEMKLMLSNTYESFKYGKQENLIEFPDDLLKERFERSTAERAILVSSTIELPELSLNGEPEGAYPLENISEWGLNCLQNTYNLINSPSEGLSLLRRFQRSI